MVARELCPFGVRALRGPLGVETQIGRSWRTEPLSRVSSWKSTAARYVAGSDASSVDATRSTAGADHTLRFMPQVASLHGDRRAVLAKFVYNVSRIFSSPLPNSLKPC